MAKYKFGFDHLDRKSYSSGPVKQKSTTVSAKNVSYRSEWTETDSFSAETKSVNHNQSTLFETLDGSLNTTNSESRPESSPLESTHETMYVDIGKNLSARAKFHIISIHCINKLCIFQ